MPTRIPREVAAAAIRRMLRPIVRQLLAWDIPYPVFDGIVRGLFVEVGESEFSLPHKRQTDSRVSLVTGIHRKEVARLRRLPVEERDQRLEDTVTARVIGRWMDRAPYVDRQGRPRVLRYESARPGLPSFSGLVREAGFDGPVRSVLDEMLRSAAVDVGRDGDVRLLREAHVPLDDVEAKLEILASDPSELFRTIAHNVEDPRAPWLQRKVAYDNIGSDALPHLREEARGDGEALIRRANTLLAAHDRDRNPDAPAGDRSRVVIGLYYFEEPMAPKDAAPSPAAPRPLPGRITQRRRQRSKP